MTSEIFGNLSHFYQGHGSWSLKYVVHFRDMCYWETNSLSSTLQVSSIYWMIVVVMPSYRWSFKYEMKLFFKECLKLYNIIANIKQSNV